MSDDTGTPLATSPLDAEHRALGAKMVPFGGWEMPIQYAGVLEEHRACREDAVMFDVSHMGAIDVIGAGAFDLLQRAFTNDLGRVEPGRAQYAHLLDADGGWVVDDVISWWLAPDRFLVVPNASNAATVYAVLEELAAAHPEYEVTLADRAATGRTLIAVQGPQARERLATVWPEAAAVGRFRVAELTWDGAPGDGAGIVAGTGYTGEDGVEIHLPTEAGVALWRALLDAGVRPAGLGARDTLRLEAAFPLHGHELGPDITPFQAGLAWVVRMDHEFRGRAALQAELDAGVARRLQGLAFDGRRFGREGAEVRVAGRAEPVGTVTSGNFSPTLGHGIALAFLAPDVEPGTAVEVDVRGTAVPATVVETPFYKR